MSIKVSTGQIKALVKNIRASFCNGAQPKLGGNLEDAARALGFRSWDACAAAAGKAGAARRDEPVFAPPVGLRIFVEAHTVDGVDDDPGFIEVDMTERLIDLVSRFSSLARDARLCTIKYETPAIQARSLDESLECTHLAVGEDYFWLEGDFGENGGSSRFETTMIRFSWLKWALQRWREGGFDFPLVLSEGETHVERQDVEGLINEGRLPDAARNQLFSDS